MLARKVILDVDPGIDDAVALCLALFDPRLEVVAVTATGGNVSPQQATLNVQAIIEQLDPPRWPRVGAASSESLPPVDSRNIMGADGLGNAALQVAELQHQHPAEKVICDEVRAAPEEITIITLGPLTNVARAFQRDPGLASQVGRLIMMGGSVDCSGNITAAAEFNIFCDPQSARLVFRSATTKTLVPLDITSRFIMTFDQFDQLPDETSRVGRLLRKILPFAFRSHRQELGLEGIYLHDAVAVLAATNPELFETTEMAADVETEGELTTGATIFDRRRRQVRQWRPNMEVAVGMNLQGVKDAILKGLNQAAKVE